MLDKKSYLLASFIALAGFSLPTQSEVLSAEQYGFSIQHVISIKAKPSVVYNTILSKVDQWWDQNHTYSGSAKNLYIEAKPLGCFCEKINDQGAVAHMTIVNLQTNQLIRMQGGLGPLQGMGVNGALSWSIKPNNNGSDLTLSYNVSGYYSEGLQGISTAVDKVLLEQITRLKKFIEQ